MILEYAKLENDTLIHVSDVKKEAVQCPFCDALLIAKRGNKKIHHFAHKAKESCRGSSIIESVDYHLYKKLSPSQINVIAAISNSSCKDFIAKIKYHGNYNDIYDLKNRKTGDNLGLGVTLRTFDSINQKGFFDKYSKNWYSGDGYCYDVLANDLSKIYMLQSSFQDTLRFFEKQFSSTENEVLQKTFERLSNSVLYFINIKTNTDNFQKIGITLNWKRRKQEIQRFLNKKYQDVVITEIKISSIAILEHYFKRFYAEKQFKIAKTTVTEYFQFTQAEIKYIKNELRKAELSTMQHREKILKGLKNRRKKGRGSESSEQFLKKPQSVEIFNLLNEGLSLRKIAKAVNCSVNTVRKVKSVM